MSGDVRRQIAEVLPQHQAWCHGEAHAECCGAGDCDCGVTDALERLLPVVDRIARQRAADELRAAAEWAFDHNDGYGSLTAVQHHLDARADALTAEA